MSPRMNEQQLLDRLAELPREISPGRDPWPEISARMEDAGPTEGSTRRRHSGWYLAAAASVVLAFAASLLMKPVWEAGPFPAGTPDGSSPSMAMSGPVSDGGPMVGSPPALLDRIDAEYVAAFREYTRVDGSHENLAPQTIEKIEMGWTELRVVETALVAALEENPGDRFLNERMLELRARQLGFLKQLVMLDRNNRRLTI